MPWVYLAQAMKRISRDLADLEEGLPTVRSKSARAKPGSPSRFATLRDPDGRFALSYPAEWKLETFHGVLARSSRIASFARVDVLPSSGSLWKQLRAAVEKVGGTIDIQRHAPGSPEHLRGKIEVSTSRFAWNAWAWRGTEETIVLSTGNVIDTKRGTKIERYEDKVLDAIRREFKGPAGA